MKRLTIAILLLMAGTGWATDYIVNTTGDNSDGLTEATAFNLPSTAITAGNAGGGPRKPLWNDRGTL